MVWYFMEKKLWWLIIFCLAALGWWFHSVFSGEVILSQVINLGIFQIRYYGLVLAAAIILAYVFALHRRIKFNIATPQAEKIIFYAIIGGFIGARLYHVFSEPMYYVSNPLEILAVWHGGLGIYGAIVGGVVGSWLASRTQLKLLKVLDWLVPSVLIGQMIGRLGNFFNYELFGYPTNFPWKMFVPEKFRSIEFTNSIFFHPLFLYESLASLGILGILLYFEPKFKSSGSLFLWYVLLYNIVRFSLEFLRIDSEFIGVFRQNALMSLLLVIGSGIIILYVRTRKVSQN